MNLDVDYIGKSGVAPGGELRFAPNLKRPPTFFDGALKDPIRFREAISALHDVVVSDLRVEKKDRSAYKAYLEAEQAADRAAYDDAHEESSRAPLADLPPMPADLPQRFRKLRDEYWRAREAWSNELMRTNPALFRALMPCDPIVTVAPDTVLFEGFAKDESAYGALYVSRDSFETLQAGEGTTNVDYSLQLYEHFQSLRTYRTTRLLVDPAGFAVQTKDAVHREEKIDLPASWLRGFGQIQAAMCLPMRTVTLTPEAVYSVLVWLRRHREKASPRALRFELKSSQRPELVLEPWEQRIPVRGSVYQGLDDATVRIWGRRRLMVLARLLPIAKSFTVHLCGSGFPSVWVADLGDMQLVLALSGWTKNDWTSGLALESMLPTRSFDRALTHRVEQILMAEKARSLDALTVSTAAPKGDVRASLFELSRRGRVVYDPARALYRFRPVLPEPFDDEVVLPDSEEVSEGKKLYDQTKLLRRDVMPSKAILVVAEVRGGKAEALFSTDNVLKRAKCSCSYFHRFGLKRGPCRHLVALRLRSDLLH